MSTSEITTTRLNLAEQSTATAERLIHFAVYTLTLIAGVIVFIVFVWYATPDPIIRQAVFYGVGSIAGGTGSLLGTEAADTYRTRRHNQAIRDALTAQLSLHEVTLKDGGFIAIDQYGQGVIGKIATTNESTPQTYVLLS